MTETETREGRATQRYAEAQATRMWRRHLDHRRERQLVPATHGGDDAIPAFSDSYANQTSHSGCF